MIELSLFDQAFYKFEQGGLSPMYMCGANIFDARGARNRLNGRTLRAHLASRLAQIPLMRKKLVQDPMRIGNMRLVEDSHFDVHEHIACATLPKPGGYREFTDYLGEFSAQRLDLSRPPWQFEIIEGLQGGRFALAYHLHHSLFDGIGAISMMRAIHDTSRVGPSRPRSQPREAESEPTRGELMSLALKENVNRMLVKVPALVAKTTVAAARALPPKLRSGRDSAAVESVKLPKVQKTSLNVDRLSNRRAVSYTEFPLADVKALARRLGCSINDLMLLLNSCALEHYFEQIGETIDFDLVATMPVNTRAPDDTARGNRLGFSRVSLYNTVGDLKQRLRAIARDTAVIKRGFQATPAAGIFPEFDEIGAAFSPIILDAMVYLMAKFNLAGRSPVFNVLITNVPGPTEPLYLAGARQVSGVPMAPPADGMGLSVTITSTDRLLLIGYHCCPQAVKDKELLVEGVRRAYALLDASGDNAGGKRRSVGKRRRASAGKVRPPRSTAA